MKLRGLCIGYRTEIATDINADLCSGDFICLIGRNGSGKSTLLRTMARLQPAITGQITIGDRLLDDFSVSELSHLISLVMTQVPDLQNTSLREFIAYGRLPYTSWLGSFSDEDMLLTDNAISQLHIEHLSDKKISNLSDGERQKALIARALAQQTDIILLDEPSAFLDYESRIELMSLLKNLAHFHHKAILLSTHDLDMANTYSDRIWKIENHSLSIRNNV